MMKLMKDKYGFSSSTIGRRWLKDWRTQRFCSDYFKDEKTKEIDEDRLVKKIRSINPQMVVMVICYIDILDLKFLLEKSGLFAQMRLNREQNIVSNGQLVTLNEIQKELFETLSVEKNLEKDAVITGPVGSGKTVMGLEAITMKIS